MSEGQKNIKIGERRDIQSWISGRTYQENEEVDFDKKIYIALEIHVSVVFATDLAAAKWVQIGGTSGGNGVFGAANDGAAIAISSASLAGTLNIGSNLLVLDGASGQVGIGIAAPTSDLHLNFTDSLFTERGFNISNNTQLILGINHDGRVGLGTQPNEVSSGGTWMNITTMANPTIGINYIFKSSASGTKTMFDLGTDNSTADSSFTFINIADSRNNGGFNKAGIIFNLQSGGGSGLMKAIQITNGICLMRQIEMQSTDAFHWGAPTSNNTWRVIRSGNDLLFERRESGSYVTKSTISA